MELELSLKEAKELIRTGEIKKAGVFYIKALKIEEDALGRKWLKVKTWLIHPEKAKKANICNAEGTGYIPIA